MWNLPPAPASSLPRYKQLIHLVEDALERGLLAAGERLPPERKLAQLLALNRTTVIRALDELADRGILIRKRGSGTYVNPEKWGLQSHAVFNWQPPSVLRAQKSRDSYSMDCAALREASRTQGVSVLDLSRDDLPLDLLPELALTALPWKELIRAEQGEETAKLGLTVFRNAVRKFLHDTVGLNVPLEQILITSGTQQALFLVTQGLCRPGDAVGVESPSYFYSLPVFQAAGLRLYALPMDAEGITLEGLDMQFQLRKLKMIFLNPVFHNPTGTTMSVRRKQEILHYCSMKHIPVFEDDAYSLLAFDAAADVSPLKTYDRHNQVIYAGSLSSYAGRNLRAGWLVAPEPVVNLLAEIRSQMDAGLSVLPQFLARQYLEKNFARHRLRLQKTLARRARDLSGWLKALCGTKPGFESPKGGLYLYARFPDGSEQESRNLCRELLKRNIILAQGTDFGDSGGAFRMNFGQFDRMHNLI